MIKTTFEQFWNLVNKEVHKPIVHRIEKPEWFGFHFKAYSGNDYYCIVMLQQVLDFAIETEISYEDALIQFFNNYLSLTMLVEDIDGVYPEFSFLEEDEVYVEEDMQKSIEPGEDVVDESDDYSQFFKKQVQLWKNRIVNKLESMPENKSYATKEFGSFVQLVMNTITTKSFRAKIRGFVKQILVNGLESAENETGVQIGFTKSFENRLFTLENQQLNGYAIDGSMWYGIKGATNEIQARILRQISEDVKTQTSRKDMINNIKAIFDGVGNAQAERIARTETTRILNEGKLTAYKESGVKGNKAYAAVMDYKTSDICRRLHDKYFEKGIPFDDYFVDDKTGKRILAPPSHVNCRCIIELRMP